MQQIYAQIYTITTTIIMLSFLGVTGFIAGKTRYLPENSGIILSRVVIKLTAPILIATTMASRSFTVKELKDGLWIHISGVVFILVAYLLSNFACKAMRLQGSTCNVYKMQSMFGNVVFLAFPLLKILYGDKGLIYAIFYNLANDTILWTLGIYLVNSHNTSRWKDNLKRLINGNTIAFLFGLACILVNLQAYVSKFTAVKNIYNLIYNTFSPLGNTTTYLSMLFIGLILSEVKIKSISELRKRYPIFILTFFKLIFMPLFALLVLSAIAKSVDPFVKTIVVLQLAMPCATIVPALAAQYDSDYKFATESVFITTLVGMVTLPLILYINGIFG